MFGNRLSDLEDLALDFKSLGQDAKGTLFEYDPVKKILYLNTDVSPKFFDIASLDVSIFHELTDIIAIKNATKSVIENADGTYRYVFTDETLDFFNTIRKTGRMDKYAERIIKINLKNQGLSTGEIASILSDPIERGKYIDLAWEDIIPQDLFEYLREKDSFLQQTDFYEAFIKPKDLHAKSEIMDSWLGTDPLDISVDGRGKTIGEHVGDNYGFEKEIYQIDNIKTNSGTKPLRAPDFWYKTAESP